MSKDKSPTDPQECCDWANARLDARGDYDRRWVVTGNPAQPVELMRPLAGPRIISGGYASRAAIVDRNPKGGNAVPSRSDESGGAGTAIANT